MSFPKDLYGVRRHPIKLKELLKTEEGCPYGIHFPTQMGKLRMEIQETEPVITTIF